MQAESPLPAEVTTSPLASEEGVDQLGPTLVVAPHPDDESLGCGGTIALLRERGLPVHVLFVSDGSGSHPGSRRVPSEALVQLREQEAREAALLLGVDDEALTFLRMPDRFVPRRGSGGFTAAVEQIQNAIDALPWRAKTVLMPWRRDPHTDHRAAWELVTAALEGMGRQPRLLEYPIWVWTLGEPEDTPAAADGTLWRLDITRMLPRKLAAIAAHRSQTTRMIDDSDTGWYLTREVLAQFEVPWEVFIEGAVASGR